ncbi:MAG: hypothetical protein LUE96_04340, partial [Lachnospiraceae bacterium]|nr:hypothetical protein [Lachnospiraceae bacterium]
DILLPFKIDDDEIFDLYELVKTQEIARLIFNEIECEVSSKDRYTIIESDNFDRPKLLVNVKNGEEFETFISHSFDNELSIISVDFGELTKDEKLFGYDDLYVRFRVNSESIKESLFCPVHKKNWFLESGFMETQIVDIKINQERNLPHTVCKNYRLKKYKFAVFKKIHLLVMSNSSDEVDSFGNSIYECRKLEEHDWDNYLGNNYDVTNIFAYHWKEKSTCEMGLLNFNKLIRISTASTILKIIVTYVLVVIVLGACGSGLLELIKLFFKIG